MTYIKKRTAPLISTRLTDAGRMMISKGKFNVKYFKLGDSEVDYTVDGPSNVLLPVFRSGDIKHEIIKDQFSTGTYGLGQIESISSTVHNKAPKRGFFVGSAEMGWSADTSYGHSISPNYFISIEDVSGNTIELQEMVCDDMIPPLQDDCCPLPAPPNVPDEEDEDVSGPCDTPVEPYCDVEATGDPEEPNVGDHVVIIFNCCDGDCGKIRNGDIVLTYRICCMDETRRILELDRPLPALADMGFSGSAKVFIYPQEVSDLPGVYAPNDMELSDIINYSVPCDISLWNPKVWNLNIPWDENPAGLTDSYLGFENFGSKDFIGTMEYLGYGTNGGQYFIGEEKKESSVEIINSLGEIVTYLPSDVISVAIIHYTNDSADLVYGEKFSTMPVEKTRTGSAANLKVSMPSLLWHKSKSIGQTFYINPPGHQKLHVNHMVSSLDLDMNSPGLRYFHLWDINKDVNGNINKVGKVFPDHKMVVIDDPEIVAAMSYKSNRNWTLPMPSLKLVYPDMCDDSETQGILSSTGETLWVTYRFSNSGFTNSMHCNYYANISADDKCADEGFNVSVNFGDEFPFLNQPDGGCTKGFFAEELHLLFQVTDQGSRPEPSSWLEVNVTDQLSGSTINGHLTPSGLTGTAFVLTSTMHELAVANGQYYVMDYLNLPSVQGDGEKCLNFGDESLFYGNIETDISATIHEMRYKINLGPMDYMSSTNPTWTNKKRPAITEINLYDEEKNLMIASRLQSPQERRGNQNFTIKLDF